MKQTKPIKVTKKVAEILDKIVAEKTAIRKRIETSAMLDMSNIKPIG